MAIPQGGVRNIEAEMTFPLGQSPRFTVQRHSDAVSTVVVLLRFVKPVAVAWFIISIHVAAFNGESLAGYQPHVVEEVAERIPSFTDANSSAAVVLVLFTFEIVAPISHVFPAAVLGGAGLTMTLAASSATRSVTAAANSPAVQEITFDCSDSSSASAFAKICVLLCSSMRNAAQKFDYRQFAKDCSGRNIGRSAGHLIGSFTEESDMLADSQHHS